MNKFDILSNIILNEAPLSSYLKKGAKLASRAVGKTIGALHDPHSSSKSQAVTQPIASVFAKMGQPSQAEIAQKQKEQRTETLKQAKTQAAPTALSKKDKIDFYMNNQKFDGSVITTLPNNLPVVQLKGIKNINSMVVEPKGKNKAMLYFYKERVPKRKSQPVQFRPGQIGYFQQLKKWVVKI